MAILNLEYYTQKDLYSDGDIEEQMLKMAKEGVTCEDLSSEQVSFPVIYHFSDLRVNILNWYPIKKSDSVLEIGAGCGAITGTLCEKAGQVTSVELSKRRAQINYYRNEKKDNLTIMVGNLNDMDLGQQYDYVVVNDGSRDKTAAICREHGFRLIDLPVNLGLAGAFQTGLRYAAENGYDCAMQLDADGQHRPEYIAAMLEELESGADIVIGSRFLTVKKPKSLRMLGSYIISWSIRLTTGRAICDPTSGMRLFNRAMVEEFAQNLNYGPEPDTISYLIKNGAVVREVQVTMGEREAGQSYLTFWRSIEYMVKMSISILLIQWFRKRDTETPYPERSL